MQNLAIISHTMWAHVVIGLKTFGDAGAPTLGMGRRLLEVVRRNNPTRSNR